MTETPTFQRARRPEHVTERREAILHAAEELLAERGLHDLTLRQIAEQSGLAPSGLLRYFDSREAIFVAVLYRLVDAWLDDYAARLDALSVDPDPLEHARNVARGMAQSMLDHALLGELISAATSVLEANIGLELMRDFKQRMAEAQVRLAALVASHVPGLNPEAATMFGGGTSLIIAGFWPHTRPNKIARQAMCELDEPDIFREPSDFLGEVLAVHLVGVLVSQPGFNIAH